MTEDRLKILIVDDEFHARKLLSEYVSKLPILELVGTASNVFEAMSILQREKIDIMLLDIQMPEITGMEFARSLKNPPAIIFTTAYSEYAVESYELDVVDYLLKPIAFTRFLQAINKVVDKKKETPVIEKIIDIQQSKEIEEDSIVIKSGYKFFKIHYDDIQYLESMREYVTIYTTKQKITTLSSMKELEDKLPSMLFIRAHKSYIVSVKHIDFIEKEHLYIAGKIIHIGRIYKEDVMKIFNGKIE